MIITFNPLRRRRWYCLEPPGRCRAAAAPAHPAAALSAAPERGGSPCRRDATSRKHSRRRRRCGRLRGWQAPGRLPSRRPVRRGRGAVDVAAPQADGARRRSRARGARRDRGAARHPSSPLLLPFRQPRRTPAALWARPRSGAPASLRPTPPAPLHPPQPPGQALGLPRPPPHSPLSRVARAASPGPPARAPPLRRRVVARRCRPPPPPEASRPSFTGSSCGETSFTSPRV